MSCDYVGTHKLGVYELVTNGFIDNAVNALYGIDPRVWRSFPCEGLALLKVRQPVSTPAAALDVAIAVPVESTVSTAGDNASGTVTSLPLVNILNEPITGAQFTNNTERLVYFNKKKGIIRLLDCCVAATPAT